MATKKRTTQNNSTRKNASRKKPASAPKPVLALGPRKERKKGIPEPQHTTHKQRGSWFQARASWPFREADVQNLVTERARTQVPQAPAPAAPQWESMGPTNIGGRCTSLACHPANPDIVWIGAAGGGVWKSTDGGGTWTPLWHSQDSLNVGALAVDSANPDVVYIAEGHRDTLHRREFGRHVGGDQGLFSPFKGLLSASCGHVVNCQVS